MLMTRPAFKSIAASRVELCHRINARLGEGSIWLPRLSMFASVDIYGPSKLCAKSAVFLHDPYHSSNATRCLPMPCPASTVVSRSRGGLVVALMNGLHFLDIESNSQTFIANPDAGAPPQGVVRRWNDGKCSPEGRFWSGTMAYPAAIQGAGALYVLEPDLTSRSVLSGVTISNGLAWDTSRGVMYYIDTPKGVVAAFDYNAENGTLSRPRTAFAIPPGSGHPDGCALDAEGHLWVAHWGGGRVVAYRPWDGGSIVAEVRVPWATNVSSVAFGGPSMRDLYITTAWEGLQPEERAAQPLAGDSFLVHDVGFQGVPAGEFAG